MSEPDEFFPRIDDIGVNYLKLGVLATKQTSKKVLVRGGSWAILVFTADKLERGGKYKPIVMIRRYRKHGGGWRLSSAINLSPAALLSAADHIRSGNSAT